MICLETLGPWMTGLLFVCLFGRRCLCQSSGLLTHTNVARSTAMLLDFLSFVRTVASLAWSFRPMKPRRPDLTRPSPRRRIGTICCCKILDAFDAARSGIRPGSRTSSLYLFGGASGSIIKVGAYATSPPVEIRPGNCLFAGRNLVVLERAVQLPTARGSCDLPRIPANSTRS
jgi:hypothetical protein